MRALRHRALGLETWQLVVAAGALISLALLGLHGFNTLALGDGSLLALDHESSVGTWYSVTNFFVASAFAFLAGAVDRERRTWWLLAGLFFLAFSVDDAVGVHEQSEDADQDLSRIVLQPAVALLASATLVQLGRHLPAPARQLVYASAFLLVLGIGSSLFNNYVEPAHTVFVLLMYVEETSEQLMATALLAACVALLDARLRRLFA